MKSASFPAGREELQILWKTEVLPDLERVFQDRGLKGEEKARSELIIERDMPLKEEAHQGVRERLFETFKKLLAF